MQYGKKQGKRPPLRKVSERVLQKRRARRRAYLALGLTGLMVLGLAAAVVLNENRARETQPGLSIMDGPPGPGGQSAPLAGQSAPPAAQQPDPAETQPEAAPGAEISSLAVPAGGWASYTFGEEEVAAMNTLLDEWAASTPEAAASETEGTEDTAATSASQSEAAAEDTTGHRVAVYFKDLDSGAEYIYGGDEKFDVASLSKAPYAMYLYQLVEQGQASLDETFLIDAEAIKGSEENSGRLKSDPNLPKELTLAEMIEYLLRYSDTVAQRVLLKRYPAEGYAAFAATLGLHNPADVRGVTSGVITALDAGMYLEALKNYMDTGAYGKELQTHLMNTSNPMIRAPWPLARKYGWDEFAYHDMAVVYAPHPYLLAILTDKIAGTQEDLSYFTTLPGAFEQIMARHWAQEQLGPNTKMGVE